MKILLLLKEKLEVFNLPTRVSGSYSFDVDYDAESKLINVEAKNGKWVLYSTSDVSINDGKSEILEEYHFYSLKKDGLIYVIYVVPTLEEMICYQYQNSFNLLVGTSGECNIHYQLSGIQPFMFKIFMKDGNVFLENANGVLIYVNCRALNQSTYYIKTGDEINVYGLRLVFLHQFIFVSNVSNLVINEQDTGLHKYVFPKEDIPKNIEISDEELYSVSDYFSKTPRFRRVIEEEEINLASPPNDGVSQEMPLILTIGPMLTMGIMSIVTITNTLIRINNGEANWSNSWPSVVSSGAMLVSMLIWPIVMRFYNKKMQKKRKEEIKTKYLAYLENKKNELTVMAREQRSIMLENLVSIDTCIDYILKKKMGFWDKRSDQNDFMNVRIGIGEAPLSMKISYHEEDFTIDESELRDKASEVAGSFKYVSDTPVSYSFYDNKTTAIMGLHEKVIHFTNNILLQLMTFYTYEDLKFVVFTSKDKEVQWNYLKYLNHTFNNEKTFRFFATNSDEAKQVGDYLTQVIHSRLQGDGKTSVRPYYFIITDEFDLIKQQDFVDILTEVDNNIGFSLVILEDRLSKLPSKCNNFINLGQTSSGVLKNSYENQEQLVFQDEIKYNIDYMALAKLLSNTPIEFEESLGMIPDSISFLEMEHVGKIEQLNILNRWHSNDSTNSLKAEIGVDEHGDLMYLDIHEKFHGPHGLIAGTTGSGKSEFIITYILSLCINYSPDDISFILIDYKGGGLALAFENRTTGVRLPHLAGTITNLDKAEMDRTLVSIDSEVKRRQTLFNQARDELGESTMDIYKYQSFYHEGRLKEPISHLLIICDEFAELKSQQPDFMDNLISVARIGRSLGVHLILATQKPSGVVNDQIWSNTRFRVCLKVQDEADSKEMLKRPEAAHIKQAGRYYLQVGYDEYFALGQSGYTGAKYYPSEKIIKEVDKSINFIDDCGNYVKSIKASVGKKVQAQGEQLLMILQSIIEVAKSENKFSKRLWLENIPSVILESDVREKYNISSVPYQVEAVIGEYDAPEKQEQGVVRYDFLNDGNTLIYGTDSSENENIIKAIIYSSTKNHRVEELNYYIVDFGSESFRIFNGLPHIGGMVFQGEDEEFYNLLKLIKNEIQRRKKLFANYGGEYQSYVKSCDKKLPLITIVFNNFDSIYESHQDLYEILPELVRDSSRYGIVYIFSCNAVNSVFSKVSQNFSNIYAFKLKDSSDYGSVFNQRVKMQPRDSLGRGLLNIDGVHEFQTVSLVLNMDDYNQFIMDYIKEEKEVNSLVAKRIPVLPDHVRFESVNEYISDIKNVPVGIDKKELGIVSHNFLQDIGNIIVSTKLMNTKNFVLSLIGVVSKIPNHVLVMIDVTKGLGFAPSTPNYYTDEVDKVLESLKNYVDDLVEKKSIQEGIILIYGFSKFISKLSDTKVFEEILKVLKKYEHMGICIVDDASKLKQYAFESWFSSTFNTSTGMWIGRGASDQSVLKISSINKEMTLNYKNDMGFYVYDNVATLVKWLDFYSKDGDDDEQ